MYVWLAKKTPSSVHPAHARIHFPLRMRSILAALFFVFFVSLWLILNMSEQAGIQFRTFEAYPRCVGAVRENFVALIENSPEGGMRLLGAAGYLIGDRIGVLVERGGQKFFQ